MWKCLDIRILYHTGELQNCVRLTDLQKSYGLGLCEAVMLKRTERKRPQSPVMPDIHRVTAQLAVINREGIRSIGEAEAYRAECRRIAGEIESLDRAANDFEVKLPSKNPISSES